jgi:drug/metabolite transporter (DMT)-like permease
MLGERLLFCGSLIAPSRMRSPNPRPHEEWFLFLLITLLLVMFVHSQAFAGSRIPGTDASDKLEAAGTLLRILDSVLFSWGARIFAGLCVMSAGWNLKEQRFGIAVLCIVAAIVLGTAPTWVKNIFDIGGGGGVFSQTQVFRAETNNA